MLLLAGLLEEDCMESCACGLCSGVYGYAVCVFGTVSGAVVSSGNISLVFRYRLSHQCMRNHVSVNSLWDCRLWGDKRPPDWLRTVGRLKCVLLWEL